MYIILARVRVYPYLNDDFDSDNFNFNCGITFRQLTMATKVCSRLRPMISSFRPSHHPRSFLTFPGTEPQTLTATRVLPYKASSLHNLIADIDNYSGFVPYCIDSKITQWSSPDSAGKRWPAEADLKVGWGGYEETFTSRLFCVPGSIVEAVSGEAATTIPNADLKHYAGRERAEGRPNHIFKSLNTRWEFVPSSGNQDTGKLQKDQTEVHLTIDFQFANPIYTALSKAVAPKVAGVMIEAFEVRAGELLDKANS